MAFVGEWTCAECNTEYNSAMPDDKICASCKTTIRKKALQHFLIELRTGKTVDERVAQLEEKLFHLIQKVETNTEYVKSKTMRF